MIWFIVWAVLMIAGARRLVRYADYRQAVNRLKRIEERKNAATEKAEEIKQAARDRAAADKQTEKERINAEKAERKKDECRTIIEHYEPIRARLVREIAESRKSYQAAERANKSGAALEKLYKPIAAKEEKLFQVERKLEKAYFQLDSG